MSTTLRTRSSVTSRRGSAPTIVFSDERAKLLGTGGGVVKALPQLGDAPFFHVNSDTLWIDGVMPNLTGSPRPSTRRAWTRCCCWRRPRPSIGYTGRGDFAMDADGRLPRRGESEVVPFVYAGVAMLAPALFAGAPPGAFSLNTLFDRAVEAGRLPACGSKASGCTSARRTRLPRGGRDRRERGVASSSRSWRRSA